MKYTTESMDTWQAVSVQRIKIVYETFVNGGSTLWYDGIERVSGYVVGDNTNPLIPGGGGGMSLGRYQVLEALDMVRPANAYDGVGSWIDEETGLVYLDNVTHMETIRGAMLLAQVNGELAIYDLANNCCIDTPYGADTKKNKVVGCCLLTYRLTSMHQKT